MPEMTDLKHNMILWVEAEPGTRWQHCRLGMFCPRKHDVALVAARLVVTTVVDHTLRLLRLPTLGEDHMVGVVTSG